MAIKPLQPAQQELIIRVLEDAVTKSASMDPSQALAEAAIQHEMPHKFIQYAVNAFNNGQSVANIKSGSTREEKAAEVPLATCDKVLEHIHKEAKQEPEIAKDYEMPFSLLTMKRPKSIKKASVRKTPPKEEFFSDEDAFRAIIKLSDNLKNARQLITTKMAQFRRSQEDVQRYLDNPNHLRLTDVREQSEIAFGPLSSVVLDTLHDSHENHKRASFAHLVRKSSAPFSLVQSAIQALSEVEQAAKDFAVFEKQAQELLQVAEHTDDYIARRVTGLLGPVLRKCSFSEDDETRKSAAKTPASGEDPQSKFLDIGGNAINQFLDAPSEFLQTVRPPSLPSGSAGKPSAPAPSSPVKPKSILEPDAANEIAGLNLTTPLNLLMATDSSLSAHPKEKIIQAYNEILNTYPRAASSVVTLRPMLQRHLAAGGLDEFALKNLADQEEKLWKIQGRPSRQSED